VSNPFAGPTYTYRLVLARCTTCKGRLMGRLCVDSDPTDQPVERVLDLAYWDTTHLRHGTCAHADQLPPISDMRSRVARALRKGVDAFGEAPEKVYL
jgi:hypothetical protein